MILKRLSCISSAAAVLAVTNSVQAASTTDAPDSAPASREPDPPDHIAMTAGVGVGGIAGVGGLAQVLSAGLEGRLFDHLWLMGVARGSYSEGSGYDAWGAGGAVGPRIVFNPKDRIQASTFLLLGASYGRVDSQDIDGSEWLVGKGEAGFTADIGIVPGVGMRLSTVLVEIARVFQNEGDSSTSIQIGPRPEIQLRVSF